MDENLKVAGQMLFQKRDGGAPSVHEKKKVVRRYLLNFDRLGRDRNVGNNVQAVDIKQVRRRSVRLNIRTNANLFAEHFASLLAIQKELDMSPQTIWKFIYQVFLPVFTPIERLETARRSEFF
jgi:hypothetical protein